MKKVLLNELPRRGKNIDWVNSVGYKVKFIYAEIQGEVEILGYDKGYLQIDYNENIFSINTGNFSRCVLGTIIGKYKFTYDFKYNVGDIIENVNSGKLKILEQFRKERGSKRKNGRFYRYECLICDHKDTILELSITSRSNGCSVCSNKQVKVGFNDIWTTNPELGKLLWNQDDGNKYTSGSRKKVDFKCPNCGLKIKNKDIYTVKDQGLTCDSCSDGKSFPSKIVFHTLTQTGIEFHSEWSPAWATIKGNKNKMLNGRKRYDFYLPTLNCVVEVHGAQHYTDTRRKEARRIEVEQENDRLKEKLLVEHAIEYIPIDAQISDLEYIKPSILNSRLAALIDFSKIDWIKCGKDSLKSLVIEACELFNNEGLTTTEIGSRLKLEKSAIIRYLKRGTKFGMCNYDPIEESRKSRIKGNKIAAKKSKKPVLQFSIEGNLLKEFSSAREATDFLGLSDSVISAVCLGKEKSAGGFMWVYKEDYEKRNHNEIRYVKKTNGKSVVRLTLEGTYIDEYESLTKAEKQLNIKQNYISAVLGNKQKTTGGFKWMYKSDYEKQLKRVTINN